MTKSKKVDPRLRMKEVRDDVLKYVNGVSSLGKIRNLGEYPKNMADARRTIIALQDMLDDSVGRHTRASDHIVELKQDSNDIHDEFANLLNEATIEIIKKGTKLRELRKNLDDSHNESARLCEGWKAADLTIENTEINLEEAEDRLEAALTTLYTVMEGVDHG